MVSRWNLSDCKSPQISRTLLGILTDLKVVFWRISTSPLIFKCSRLGTNSLVTVPSAPITTGITVTFMFHSFFSSLVRFLVLISLFDFFLLYPVISQNGKNLNSVGSLFFSFFSFFFFSFFFFFLTITRFGRLAEIRWSVCISKSLRSLCISLSKTDSGLCIHHLFMWSNFNFLHYSQWITFTTQLCLDLYTFFLFVEHEDNSDTHQRCNHCNIHKESIKDIWKIEDSLTNCNCGDYSATEINSITEKIPEKLFRFSLTRSSIK